MNVILITAVAALGVSPSTFYSGLDENPIPPSVFYSGLHEPEPEPKKVEEKDETPAAENSDHLLVVVYVDLDDRAGLRKLLSQCDRLPGLHIEYRDKAFVPDSGKRFKLPLALFHGNDGWRFREWVDAEDFRRRWIELNTGPNGRIPPEAIRLQRGLAEHDGKDGAASEIPSRYPAWSHEWHLTQGESIESLRSHLSVPQRAHHGASFPRAWLDTLSFIDLIGVHSDAHNNRVRWEYVGTTAAPADSRSGSRDSRPASGTPRKSEPIASVSISGSWLSDVLKPKKSRRAMRRSSGGCPGGKCPR